MNLLTKILLAALSLSGVLAGVALSYIAREELSSGKKYFLYLRYGLFVVISVTILYSLFFQFKFLMPIFFIFLVLLFIVDLKFSSKIGYLFHYLAFLAGYFLLEDEFLIAALIFLYGFPVGTLLRMKHE